jgi:hypothetical protein
MNHQSLYCVWEERGRAVQSNEAPMSTDHRRGFPERRVLRAISFAYASAASAGGTLLREPEATAGPHLLTALASQADTAERRRRMKKGAPLMEERSASRSHIKAA